MDHQRPVAIHHWWSKQVTINSSCIASPSSVTCIWADALSHFAIKLRLPVVSVHCSRTEFTNEKGWRGEVGAPSVVCHLRTSSIYIQSHVLWTDVIFEPTDIIKLRTSGRYATLAHTHLLVRFFARRRLELWNCKSVQLATLVVTVGEVQTYLMYTKGNLALLLISEPFYLASALEATGRCIEACEGATDIFVLGCGNSPKLERVKHARRTGSESERIMMDQ
jgi:hypothetical protein